MKNTKTGTYTLFATIATLAIFVTIWYSSNNSNANLSTNPTELFVKNTQLASTSDEQYIKAMESDLLSAKSNRQQVKINNKTLGKDNTNLAAIADLAAQVKTSNNSKVSISTSSAKGTDVDYLNRVVLNTPKNNRDKDIYATLVQSLLQNKDNTKPTKKDDSYLAALDPLTKQRQNETRTITVKAGESLWLIAKRAYNNGGLYNKIFAANPHILSNPNAIYPGQVLRVPV
jgi:LysM repeat protein